VAKKSNKQNKTCSNPSPALIDAISRFSAGSNVPLSVLLLFSFVFAVTSCFGLVGGRFLDGRL